LAIFCSLNLCKKTEMIVARRRTTVELALLTVGNGLKVFRSQKNRADDGGGKFPNAEPQPEKCGNHKNTVRFPAIKASAALSMGC
jgi:hypothetical protein